MNDSTDPQSGRPARFLKRSGLAIIGVLSALLVAHVTWTSSGSNEWKLVSDHSGVRISTLKTPGYSLLKYKVDMHVDSKLSDIVFFLTDLQSGGDVGAFDISRIEHVAAHPVNYVYDTYKLNLPRPFGPIQVMIVNQYFQDPATKQVSVNVYAAPNKRPLDTSIARVVHLSNNWILTPLASGGVDIESVSELDLGIPYVLANFVMPRVLDEEVSKMRAVLKQDKYKNGKPAFISELPASQQVADAGRDISAPAASALD